MSQRPYWTVEEYEQLDHMAAKGWGYQRIARALNRSPSSVFLKLKQRPEQRTKPKGQIVRGEQPYWPPDPPRPYDPLHDNPRMKRILGGSP